MRFSYTSKDNAPLPLMSSELRDYPFQEKNFYGEPA